ncbi:MAG TPA: hypothetical protein VF021_05665 [Longimicrobiales bacterium]
MRRGRVMAAALLAVLVAGCAVRLGGSKPINEDAVALRLAESATPEQTANMLKQRGVEVAILSSTRDSAWYAAVATAAGMKMTRVGRTGAGTFAFLGPQAIGDTTLTLKVQGGGEVRLHDALYRIDKQRRLDLMAVRIAPEANLRESVRTLLAYFATDVLPNAAVVFAIEPPTPALGDSVSVLMRAAFADAWECTREGRDGARNTELPIRLFYGPSMRVTCEGAERLNEGGGAILAHLVLR